ETAVDFGVAPAFQHKQWRAALVAVPAGVDPAVVYEALPAGRAHVVPVVPAGVELGPRVGALLPLQLVPAQDDLALEALLFQLGEDVAATADTLALPLSFHMPAALTSWNLGAPAPARLGFCPRRRPSSP